MAAPTPVTLSLGFQEGRNFGILKARVPEAPSAFDAVHWIFAVDQSGSMRDPCKDGQSKLTHIKRTITHIVDFLAASGDQHYVTLIGFSGEAVTLCSARPTADNLADDLPCLLDRMEAGGPTSFEAGLRAVDQALGVYIPACAGKNLQRVNVFMSDGRITRGTQNTAVLRQIYAHHSTPHLFIGFGVDSATATLEALADTPRGAHYFIEEARKAGMVYGEIIHTCLYEALRNVRIQGSGLEVFDFKTGSWVRSLPVSDLPCGKERTWQVRRACQEDGPAREAHAAMYFALATEAVRHQTADRDGAAAFAGAIENDVPETRPPEHVVVAKAFAPGDPDASDANLERYYWRQRTQAVIARTERWLRKDPQSRSRKRSPNPLALRRQGHGLARTPPRPASARAASEMLHAAAAGDWDAVDAALARDPGMVNARPDGHDMCLLHHAVSQNDPERVKRLLSMGGDPIAATASGLTCRSLARAHAPEMLPYIPEPEDPGELIREELFALRAQLRERTSGDSELSGDAMLQGLCDDIRVAILSTGSVLGHTFVLARQSSSGHERAYSIEDVEELRLTSSVSSRDPGNNEARRESNGSAYATPAAARIMRSCSGRDLGGGATPSRKEKESERPPEAEAEPQPRPRGHQAPYCSVTLRRPSFPG